MKTYYKLIIPIILVLGLFLLLGAVQALPKDDCRKVYPDPVIKFDHKDAAGRIYIPVVNWAVYPNEMFRKAPELPPCGANPNSARTWIDIYDAASSTRLYGFCALGVSSDLKSIWFKPAAGVRKGVVFIIMYDRACQKYYKSNTIDWWY
jgi:hypothetical protein